MQREIDAQKIRIVHAWPGLSIAATCVLEEAAEEVLGSGVIERGSPVYFERIWS